MPPVPQGLTEAQFANLSARVRASASHLGNDIQVQGSRVKGAAQPDSDLDIAIRVSSERFKQLLRERFHTESSGSTMHVAVSYRSRAG